MRRRLILTLLLSAVTANAQWQLDHETSAKVNRALDAGINGGDKLKCTVRPIDPFLDFSFRFDSGYVAACPVKEFGGKPDTLIAYTRIMPENGAPVILANAYRLPGIPASMADRVDLSKLANNFEMSGGFVLGEGQFKVDVLMVDNRNRFYRTHWTVKARRNRQEKGALLTLAPNTVSPYPLYSWEGEPKKIARPGWRLTILLDAAPMMPRSDKLRAWDRAFLLDALTSLLRQTPAESVRLIAFNLDQQREIFRQDHFDRAGFTKLSNALSRLELGTVSYKALARKAGWAEMLAQLVNEQITQPSSSDSVIFLGPAGNINAKLPQSMLNPCGTGAPQFFYLEYFPRWRLGREFSDAIHSAVQACNGQVLKIHSPGEFAEAIRKLNEHLAVSNAPSNSSGATTWTRESLRTN